MPLPTSIPHCSSGFLNQTEKYGQREPLEYSPNAHLDLGLFWYYFLRRHLDLFSSWPQQHHQHQPSASASYLSFVLSLSISNAMCCRLCAVVLFKCNITKLFSIPQLLLFFHFLFHFPNLTPMVKMKQQEKTTKK